MSAESSAGSETKNRESIEAPEPEGPSRYLPILDWWPGHGWGGTLRDLRAGLFVAILLIPQAMAYSQLADLTPAMGLRAAVVAPLLYALFGTSRYLAVGPVALVSLLVAEVAGSAAQEAGVPAWQVMVTLTLLVGLALVGLGLLRFGFLANFLSSPVITGFVHAAALIIAVSQLPKLVGIAPPQRGDSPAQAIADLAPRLVEAHGLSLLVGVGALVLLLVAGGPLGGWLRQVGLQEATARLVTRSVPMLVVVVAIALSWGADWTSRGVATVGEIRAAVPVAVAPEWRPGLWRQLLPSALVIAVVGFVTSLAVARSLAQRRRERVDANQELIALGASNLLTAVFSGYPVGGSMSRSAVAFDSGGRSPLAVAFAGLLVLVASFAAAPAIARLPLAVLAAVVMSALANFVQPRVVLRIWRYDRKEAWVVVLTFLAVLTFGVEVGLVTGATLALSLHLWRTTRPRFVIEAPLPEADDLRSIDHHEVDEKDTYPVLVMRLDETLFFANVRYFENTVLEKLSRRPDVLCLLLDFRAVSHVDVSGFEMLEQLLETLEAAGVQLALAEIKEPLHQRLGSTGFLDRLGDSRVFLRTADAVEELCRRNGGTGAVPVEE
jgi:SulP family sulfate permease